MFSFKTCIIQINPCFSYYKPSTAAYSTGYCVHLIANELVNAAHVFIMILSVLRCWLFSNYWETLVLDAQHSLLNRDKIIYFDFFVYRKLWDVLQMCNYYTGAFFSPLVRKRKNIFFFSEDSRLNLL